MDTSSAQSPYFLAYKAAQAKLADKGFLSRDISVLDLVVSVTARPHHNNASIIRDEDRCRTMTYATRTSTCRPSAWAAASI